MDTDLILLERFAGSHPLETAQILEGFQEEEMNAVLDEFPIDILVGTAALMNKYKIANYLKLVKLSKAVAIMEKIDLYSAELILRLCNEDLRNEILKNISSTRSVALRQKLSYKSLTIGSLMSPLHFYFQKEQTVKKAKMILKSEKTIRMTVFPVINTEGILEGIVKIQDLFMAENNLLIESIMNSDIPKLSADNSIESVNNIEWFEYQSIPVVDSLGKLIGILDFEMLHKHKIKKGTEQRNLTSETANSLGELYRLGLTGFIQSISK